MCGIVGFSSCCKKITENEAKKIVSQLLVLSETRGKEAAGAAIMQHNKLNTIKRALPAAQMVKLSEYEKLFSQEEFNAEKWFSIIGHSRLVTNGTQNEEDNNQPVIKEQTITVHNGIIVNADELWKEHSEIKRASEVDTEIFTALYEEYRKIDTEVGAVQHVYQDIYGMANTLNMLCDTEQLVAATNNGSLYYCWSCDHKSIVLASEELMLRRLFERNKTARRLFLGADIQQLKANTGIIVDLKDNMNAQVFPLVVEPIEIAQQHTKKRIGMDVRPVEPPAGSVVAINPHNYRKFEIDPAPIQKLRRCTKCVLPETMPFIEFDENGVCNYCHTYTKQKYLGKDALSAWADRVRRKDGQVDSIVSFSGGRDSSYGLHYFVRELGLHPVCFSYDWGMVTDLARRNQSRMCASLGVELIVDSADIAKKRDNIRRNVTAWLKKPDLGMVPIFMAGDKQYFYYANQVRKDLKVNDVLMASNPFEKTHFKSGFCGSRPSVLNQKGENMALEQLALGSVLRMAGHYARQYITNPSYINRSILDTAGATICYYAIPHKYLRLYDYIPWEENELNDVLLNEYDWEISADTQSTWRIGDGTAPFYNYIYYCVAGFTENDTLRSNQIREGMLTREEALKLVERDNTPRFDSMQWYFDVIGVDMSEALTVVNKIPKRYIF